MKLKELRKLVVAFGILLSPFLVVSNANGQVNDYYDYYGWGYDDAYDDDWFYDWYDYGYDDDFYYSDSYYDYGYDTDADLFDWEEDGLFE